MAVRVGGGERKEEEEKAEEKKRSEKVKGEKVKGENRASGGYRDRDLDPIAEHILD